MCLVFHDPRGGAICVSFSLTVGLGAICVYCFMTLGGRGDCFPLLFLGPKSGRRRQERQEMPPASANVRRGAGGEQTTCFYLLRATLMVHLFDVPLAALTS